MAKTPTHNSWRGMCERCVNPNHRQFKDYGGRGIEVCPRWRASFAAFFADMGVRPEGTSIDRRNNAEGYSPTNCCWSPLSVQARNRRNNRPLTFDGHTFLVAEWAEVTGISSIVIRGRIDVYNWSIADALTIPVGMAPKRQQLVTWKNETLDLKSWSVKVGLSYGTLRIRLLKGWSVDRAFSTPSLQGQGKRTRKPPVIVETS